MGRRSPEPLGDAEWGRWPFYNPPRPLPGSKRPQAPPSGAEAPGGGLGKGTVAKAVCATVLGRRRRPRSPRGAGLQGRRLFAGGGSVRGAGASGGRGNPGLHVAFHPLREWRLTFPQAAGSGVGSRRK